MSDWNRGIPVDMASWEQRQNGRNTAQAAKETRQLIEQLVAHTVAAEAAAEVRERQMLKWTQAGVVLAAIAAVASIVAILVTVLVS